MKQKGPALFQSSYKNSQKVKFQRIKFQGPNLMILPTWGSCRVPTSPHKNVGYIILDNFIGYFTF